MNLLKRTNVHQNNQEQKKSIHLHNIPSVERNNTLNENDEFCYELDQSTYSNISNSNKSQQNNNSTIQMISELSDLNNNDNYQKEPLKYINHFQVNNNYIDIKNRNKKKKIKNKNFDLNIKTKDNENYYKEYITLNNLNDSSSSSKNYDINEIDIKNNDDNIDKKYENIDNEWNVPKITFSEISKVSRVISSDFYSSSNNNINNINIIQENLNIKKNLKKQKAPNSDMNFQQKKNIESKFSIDDNYKTINLLSSQYSNTDFLKQNINNCLIKTGYKDIIDNTQKILTKSSSLDFLNEYSNYKIKNEKIKKTLIMQMVLFTNMKNEMEILKKDNDELIKKINIFKKEKILNNKFKEEFIKDNNKKLNEINFLKNKIKKYKDNIQKYDNLKNELKNLIKKNDHLIKNNDKIITENKELKDELIKLKKINEKDKNENSEKEKIEFINKMDEISNENKNLYEIIETKNEYIKDLEKKINNQKIKINNYLEKINQFQDKINQKTNKRKNKSKTQTHSHSNTHNNKFIIKEETNEFNKANNLLFLNLYDINNNIKNSNIENNININVKHNEDNIKNHKKNCYQNNNFDIDYYKNKILEKNNVIKKLKSENINLINQNGVKEKQIKELLNIKSENNVIETKNNELENEINKLDKKYTELMCENNNNNLEKNNLENQIDKLNKINKKKEEEIFRLKSETEKINKKIISKYNKIIDSAKKIKIYTSNESQNNNINLFIPEFKELIENLNNQNFDENLDEMKYIESICNFINLIPLEIEILFMKILSFKKDYANSKAIAYISANNNTVNKTKNNNEIRIKSNNYLKTNSDISINKKNSKFKTIENSIFFRNRRIKVKKLAITDLSNNINVSINKFIQNSKNRLNFDIQNYEGEEKKLKKSKTNLYTKTIKSSRSLNFRNKLNKKVSPLHTIKFFKDNDIILKGRLNLKKSSFNKNNEEKSSIIKNKNNSNDKNNYIFKKKENIIKKINKDNLGKNINISKKEENKIDNPLNLKYKNNTNAKAIISRNNKIQKNEFRLLKNKLINSGFKLRQTMKKNIPQSMMIFPNNKKRNDILYNNGKYRKSEASMSELSSFVNKNQISYRKKILHKINNSVNMKRNTKKKISLNSSISSENKKNNSFNIN